MAAEWKKQEDCIITFLNEPEDSGIDSGIDSKLLEDDAQNKMEDMRVDFETTPLIPWQKSRDKSDNLFNMSSHDRSSPPLYEVELTASEEDEDTSVLELVIPVSSSNKFKKLPKKIECSFFFKVVCCFRG